MLLFVAASVVLLVVVNVVFVVVDVVVLLLHLLSFVAQCIRAELIRAFSFFNVACQCVVVMTSLPFCFVSLLLSNCHAHFHSASC